MTFFKVIISLNIPIISLLVYEPRAYKQQFTACEYMRQPLKQKLGMYCLQQQVDVGGKMQEPCSHFSAINNCVARWRWVPGMSRSLHLWHSQPRA